MSYHFYGQADWFYGGKPPADAPKYDEDPSGHKLAPIPPAGGTKPPALKAAPAPPPPATYYEDEGEGGGLLLYAGIGVIVLTMILIYFKFIRGGSEPVVAEAPKPKKPKTIKVEIAMDEDAA